VETVQEHEATRPLICANDQDGPCCFPPRRGDPSNLLQRNDDTLSLSSCVCPADLQCVDGLGELPGAPGAAAELAEDAPGLELVLSWAFARSPGERSFAWARLAAFRDSGLFFPLYGTFACAAPW